MADTPNYKSNVGHLVTDRYDFEKHINGEDFTHTGNLPGAQITIAPAVTINTHTLQGAITCSNVNTAIQAITSNLANPVSQNIPSASPTVEGITKLAGDISGTSTNIIVNGLQGRKVSSVAPSDGNILTWDLNTTSWIPAINAAYFSASGDLSGTNSIQNVISITGSANTAGIKCGNLTFSENINPNISQTDNTTTDGNAFYINAQNSIATDCNGGDIFISAGSGTGSGGSGRVALQTNKSTVLEVVSITPGRSIVSLCGTVGYAGMPSNTGDGVIYISNAIAAPTSGNPVGGAILYSSSGNLHVKQSDGNDFQIGSLSNPFTWGATGQQLITKRFYGKTNGDSPITAYSFVLDDNTFVAIDAVFVFVTAAGGSGYYHKSMGYERNSGTSSDVGTVADVETARNNYMPNTLPTITRSTNTISVKTGSDGTYDINWFVVIKLYFVTAA